jgi:hypothetical protein
LESKEGAHAQAGRAYWESKAYKEAAIGCWEGEEIGRTTRELDTRGILIPRNTVLWGVDADGDLVMQDYTSAQRRADEIYRGITLLECQQAGCPVAMYDEL